mgnify:CR=1 FL=1
MRANEPPREGRQEPDGGAPGLGPLVRAGLVLGIGLGAFVDGIVLHQVLQWHHMLTSAGYPATTVMNLQVNTLWDGIFHGFAWVTTALGVALLWRYGQSPAISWSSRGFVGSLLAGWGLFNLVEGIVDHHLLGIHHVREGVANQVAWELSFLVFGALLVLAGWWLVRSTGR